MSCMVIKVLMVECRLVLAISMHIAGVLEGPLALAGSA